MTALMSPGELTRLVEEATGALPRNATPFERASLAAHFFHQIDVPLETLWNPMLCPAEVLPFLAWALSVDVWYDDWPIEKKRSVAAASLEMHGIKGTLEGIRRYAALAGGEVARAIVPPAKSYLSASLTAEERRDFMRRLPEIRIRSHADASVDRMSTFSGPLEGSISSFDVDAGGLIPSFYVESEAPQLMGRRAELRDLGEITPLVIETVRDDVGNLVSGAERFLIPGDGAGGSFLDAGPLWTLYFCEPFQEARLVTVSLGASALDESDGMTAARDSMFPVPLIPEYVHETGVVPDGVFSGTFADGFHFVESRASLFLYTSIRLHDARRDVLNRVAISFMGTERFGIDAHTAELAIAVNGVRSPWASDDFVWGFFVETPTTQLDRVLDAVMAAKAAHETILVDTTVDRPPLLGGDIFIGAFRLGQPVRG
ncbi:phage tail protein I [Phreatobacter sp. HK31-P]